MKPEELKNWVYISYKYDSIYSSKTKNDNNTLPFILCGQDKNILTTHTLINLSDSPRISPKAHNIYNTYVLSTDTMKTADKSKEIHNDKSLYNPNIIEIPATQYIVQKGNSLSSIAKKYEIDTYQLITANPQLKSGKDYKIIYRRGNVAHLESHLKESTQIKIPARYRVKENSVKNITDLCEITGLSEGYIKDLLTVIEVKATHPGKPDLITYDDGYKTPTIGYGHTGKVDGKPLSLTKKIKISETKALQLLAEDLIKHEAMVIAYLGKENYEKAPHSVRAAIVDVAYNKGIWDGFLNPYHNSSTKKIVSDLQKNDYVSALCHTIRMNTPNRGLKRRNLYRFISGLSDLNKSERDTAIKNIEPYYRFVYKSLTDAEKLYMKKAWINAKNGITTGYKIQRAQKHIK